MKKIGIILTISMLICSVNLTDKVNAESIEQETFSVTNYNYATKTENEEVLVKENFVNNIKCKSIQLGVEESNITSGYNPGLPVDKNVIENSNSRTIINIDAQGYVNPEVYPYSAVLMLRLGQDTDGNGTVDYWTRGTAFMEGHNVAVTAGHNIWSHTGNYGWIEKCIAYVKQNGSALSTINYEPNFWTVPTAFISNTDHNNDWAVMTFGVNIGGTTGWFGKGKGSTVNLAGKVVGISGYPTETSYKNGRQYKDSDGITGELETNRLKYRIDTEAGQSGSPIYDANYTVWGIHTMGGSNYNYGVQICDWLYNMLQTRYLEGVELYG